MGNLRDLVRSGKADSALAFRERAYGKGDEVELLRDVSALANAAATGSRFLCLGVRDSPDLERTFPGVSRQACSWIQEILPRLVDQAIEPQLSIRMITVTLGEALVGVICVEACDDPPYLFSRRVSSLVSAGSGWIRYGIKQRPLLRQDLERIFEKKFRACGVSSEIRVGFQGPVPREEITLPVLPLDAMPSVLAARRVEKMLDARRLSKAVLGHADTRIDRLVHAQVSNEAQAYRSHDTTTLRTMLCMIPREQASADEHYQFETRTHKLNLLVGNLTDAALTDVLLVLKIPRVEGVGVVDRIRAAAGMQAALQQRYPLVEAGPHAVSVQADGIYIPKGATVNAFREPLRVYLREPVVGKTIPVSYSLSGRGLSGAIRGTLRIVVGQSEPAAPRT
jgi:hypothetical protein